jgi:beta-N-acetylhexosaminidase
MRACGAQGERLPRGLSDAGGSASRTAARHTRPGRLPLLTILDGMRRKTIAICLLLCGCRGPCNSGPAPSNTPPASSVPAPAGPVAASPFDAPPSAWVTKTLAELTLRDKIAQMMLPWTLGNDPAEGTEPFERLATWVSTDHVGGVIIGNGTPASYAAKLNAMQRRAKVPLLVVTDLESGPGMRLVSDPDVPRLLGGAGGTDFPPVMGLGAARSDSLAFAVGQVIAEEARAVGVGLTLSPVLDVNSNPANPIINTRSFGERPEDVGRLAAAYVRGIHAGGLLAAGKHFPGHGDTHTDSHVDLPSVSATRARLDSVDLKPFRAAIAGGIDGVLVGHISVPALEPDGSPGSMSPRVSTALLRDELGFRGLVVTDAMNMGGLTRRYSEDEAAVRAIEAGADLLLQPPHPRQAIDAVERAVQSGRLTEARIDVSVRRILIAKDRLRLQHGATVDPRDVGRIVASPEHRATAELVALRSITLVRDERNLVPLTAAARRILSITYTDAGSRSAGVTFDGVLKAAGRQVRSVRVDPRTTPAEYAALRRQADSVDVVLVSAYVSPREYKGTVSATGGFGAFVEGMAAERVPVVAVSFGSPYLLSDFPSVPAYMLAWGGCGACQRAAARALLGGAPITGRLPVSLPPRYPVGAGIDRAATVETPR